MNQTELDGFPTLPPEQYNLEGLLNYLQDQALLLILDNIEHLLAGLDVVTAILAHAPLGSEKE